MNNRFHKSFVIITAAALAVSLLSCQPKAAVRVSVQTSAAHDGKIVKDVDFSVFWSLIKPSTFSRSLPARLHTLAATWAHR